MKRLLGVIAHLLRVQQLREAIDMQDIAAFAGLGAMCYGLHQVYPPAAWIIGGAAVFWLAAVRRA